MGTKNHPGAFDCYANAHPDEPMFILLARDKHAPTLVWLWAALRELDGEDQAKVAEARACAVNMMAWAKAHDRTVVGFGQSALAAVLELIKTVNGAIIELGNKPSNETTDIEVVRRFLGATNFER